MRKSLKKVTAHEQKLPDWGPCSTHPELIGGRYRGAGPIGGVRAEGRGGGGCVGGGRNANELFWERRDLMKEVYALGLGEAIRNYGAV